MRIIRRWRLLFPALTMQEQLEGPVAMQGHRSSNGPERVSGDVDKQAGPFCCRYTQSDDAFHVLVSFLVLERMVDAVDGVRPTQDLPHCVMRTCTACSAAIFLMTARMERPSWLRNRLLFSTRLTALLLCAGRPRGTKNRRCSSSIINSCLTDPPFLK